jgi:hypothetical protein
LVRYEVMPRLTTRPHQSANAKAKLILPRFTSPRYRGRRMTRPIAEIQVKGLLSASATVFRTMLLDGPRSAGSAGMVVTRVVRREPFGWASG